MATVMGSPFTSLSLSNTFATTVESSTTSIASSNETGGWLGQVDRDCHGSSCDIAAVVANRIVKCFDAAKSVRRRVLNLVADDRRSAIVWLSHRQDRQRVAVWIRVVVQDINQHRCSLGRPRRVADSRWGIIGQVDNQ